jgi:pimeloyl-ACP methyl ester carboxylesterase
MALRFGTCEIDTDAHEFRRDGSVIALEPQVFDLLVLFASNPGLLIGRDRIIDEIWNGRIVSDAAISSRINAVRRAVGDDGARQMVLQTVPRRGFRFVAQVENAQLKARDTQPGERQAIRIATSQDGTQIAFATSGAGPVLLRAGHFLTHLERDWSSPVWRPMLDRLATGRRLVRYDQRGTGLSDPRPPTLTLDAMVADLTAVADAAGADRAPIFAASQGVPVAIAFAAACPDRVSRLVLYGGFCTGRRVGANEAERARADAVLTLLREGWGQHGSAFATAFATLYMPDADQEKIASMTEMQLASANPDMAAALRMAIDGFDVRELLSQVQAPTLVLHMQDDAVQPCEEARRIASGIPGAELRIFEGRNHVPLPGRPEWDAIMDATDEFLDRTL